MIIHAGEERGTEVGLLRKDKGMAIKRR